MSSRLQFFKIVLCFAFLSMWSPETWGGEMGVSVKEAGDVVIVEVDGKLFTKYDYKSAARPFFYPVIGPTGVNVTRHWPMKKGVEGEQTDHAHHRGLWYVHGDVNGHDFWTEGRGPKIVHQKFTKLESGADCGVIESESQWVDKSGKPVCSDRRRHTIRKAEGAQIIDFEITMIASHGKVTMGDTKEGSMAIRVPATMRVKGKVAKGHILNSEGIKDKATWGKKAKWVAYYGPVEGEVVNIAIFDHPTNPRHPTWWHVRDYGLFAANPFGIRYFDRKKGRGDLVIEEGKSVTFRYRIVFQKGEANAAKLEELFKVYAAAK